MSSTSSMTTLLGWSLLTESLSHSVCWDEVSSSSLSSSTRLSSSPCTTNSSNVCSHLSTFILKPFW
ncbi:hypothetical protein PF010_g22651 [Phytophthora fragariae]|uniref:REJ domain-containing protein n=1 Tax=Phytophthora fragariae TaxID=53985 RepID=A0A6G0K8B0_9STRA|nr:hypothetical protein PF010_g22651 [Phytophthora fragariae]